MSLDNIHRVFQEFGKKEMEELKKVCYSNFNLLIEQIQNTDWRKEVKSTVSAYNLEQYKLELLTPRHVKLLYQKLKIKYQKMQNQKGRIYWFQNELKIFVWLSAAATKSLGVPFKSYGENQIRRLTESFLLLNEGLSSYQYHLLTSQSLDDPWTPQETQLLSNLVKKYNANGSWTTISKELFLDSDNKFLRTAHSCRQKWQNHLDTRLIKGQWTVEEDYSIIKNRVLLGKKWSLIAKTFGPVRTEHMIKNRYKALLKKELKKKEMRSMEQIQVCKQIQNKLFLQLNLLTSPVEVLTAASEGPTKNCHPSKFDGHSKKEMEISQLFNNQQKEPVPEMNFQQPAIPDFMKMRRQNRRQYIDFFFDTGFLQTDLKFPSLDSFEITSGIQFIEEDFKHTRPFMEEQQFEHLL